MSDCNAKLVPVDDESDHQIVHGRRFGKADRTAHEPFDSGPQIDGFTLDGLRGCPETNV